MDLPSLLLRARTSSFTRWWLNTGLRWMIPFNQPHGFQVVPLKMGGIRVDIPFWRVNRNHIKGIHACCLATAAEYCSGLAMMERLDAKKYRIIMKTLRMDYHYQAKAAAYAQFAPSAQELDEHILQPLLTSDAVLYTALVEVRDAKNHLATANVTWQVKEWGKVRTRV